MSFGSVSQSSGDSRMDPAVTEPNTVVEAQRAAEAAGVRMEAIPGAVGEPVLDTRVPFSKLYEEYFQRFDNGTEDRRVLEDIYGIEKVWGAIYEAARQHGDFSSKKSNSKCLDILEQTRD